MNYLNKNGLSTLINKIKASLNAKANSSDIPTKFSQLTNDAGYLNSIPTASADTLGGVKVGDGLTITDGILSATSPLKDKKITVIGDSLSTGYTESTNWVNILAENTGATVVNLSGDGATLAYRDNDDGNNFVSRRTLVPTDTDYIVVMGGGNDMMQSINPGTKDDKDNPYTTGGSVYQLIVYFQQNIPNAKLVFITEPPIGSSIHEQYDPYANIILEMCAIAHIPCFDMHRNFGLNPAISQVREIYWLEDYVHLTITGQKYMSAKIQKFLENEVVNNSLNASTLNGYKLSILTATEYASLSKKDSNTIYITKNQKAYLGNVLILGGGTTSSGDSDETDDNLFDTVNYTSSYVTSYEILGSDSFKGIATAAPNSYVTFSVNVEANTDYKISFDVENTNTDFTNWFVVTNQSDTWDDTVQQFMGTSGVFNSGENTKIHIRMACSSEAVTENTTTFTNIKVVKLSSIENSTTVNPIDATLWGQFFKINTYVGADYNTVTNSNPILLFEGTATGSKITNLSEENAIYAYGAAISHVATTLDAGKTITVNFDLESTNVQTHNMGFYHSGGSFGNMLQTGGVAGNYNVTITNTTSAKIDINGIGMMIDPIDATGYTLKMTINSITIS